MDIENIILKSLIHDVEYMRRVVPFLKREYFDGHHKIVFDCLVDFVAKYNKTPTIEALKIEVEQDSRVTNPTIEKEVTKLVTDLSDSPDNDVKEWILDKTEAWCQDKAIYMAIMKSIDIIDGKNETLTKNALPSILTEALSVNFDTNVGHDYIEDAMNRFDYYNKVEERIPFDLDYFNRITGGGLPKKTLNLAMSSTGVGKSLFMCHVAASTLKLGKNALYITMEMAEERIAERIDSNLMDVPIQNLSKAKKDVFKRKIEEISRKIHGKLVIKEYPTGGAHVGHFRALLNELRLKKNFVPDIVFVDYLNICSSSRMRQGGAVNTYVFIKAIAEELRGLAIEFNVPIVTATQSNRDGISNSDVDLTNTSDSIGVPQTCDLMFALISNEELEGMGQIMVKQLKNRYNDPTKYKRFLVGIDRAKMRLFDLDSNEQNTIAQEPVPAKAASSVPSWEPRDFSSIKVS